MVIYIDKTIGKMLEERNLTDAEEAFFEEIANASRRGYCFLCGDRQTLRQLEKVNRTYRSHSASASQHGAIIASVSKVIVITRGDAPMLPPILPQENAISIPLEKAMQLQLNIRPTLLAENLSDCTFYEGIGRRYLSDHHYRQVEIALHHENGGGNPIGRSLEKCVAEDKTPTLCITDMDWKYGKTERYPNDIRAGETWKGAKDAAKRLREQNPEQNPPFELYGIEVHEVENLIPLTVLETISRDGRPEMEPGIQALKTLSQLDEGLPNTYYDLKNGITLRPQGDDVKREYWIGIKERLRESDYEYETEERTDDRGRAYSVILPKVSGNRLFETSLNALKDRYKTVELETYMKTHWEKIGERIYTWGCACEKIRA